jgi:hypothetical protein
MGRWRILKSNKCNMQPRSIDSVQRNRQKGGGGASGTFSALFPDQRVRQLRSSGSGLELHLLCSLSTT